MAQLGGRDTRSRDFYCEAIIEGGKMRAWIRKITCETEENMVFTIFHYQ